MMHLPVSKVFISTTGYGRSRKEGRESEQSHLENVKGYFDLISGLFCFFTDKVHATLKP